MLELCQEFKLKILICGAGQVGLQIARQLSSENNDVTIISAMIQGDLS